MKNSYTHTRAHRYEFISARNGCVASTAKISYTCPHRDSLARALSSKIYCGTGNKFVSIYEQRRNEMRSTE